MASKGLFSSSIGRKYAMALSALFLLVFLLQHLSINLLSVFSPDAFNEVSHFMGTFPVGQFVLQPILIVGVIFHFIMGFWLEIKNRGARPQSYAMTKGSANSSWMSRNMIWSGAVILAFLGLHFADFWIPELVVKYAEGDMTGLLPAADGGGFRYYEELKHKFVAPWRVGAYVICFILLAMHLLHGFQSAFQSMGARHPKYTPIIKLLGKVYAILIPAGFIFIAIFHHFNH